MEAFQYTLSKAAHLIHSNKLSPIMLMKSTLHRIDLLEDELEAWVQVDREAGLSTAEKLSKEAEEGMLRGPLHGIPIGVKDIYYTKGMRTEAGSRILAGFKPSYDATSVARLKDAGAILLGKTETTEFASFDPAPTRNPWNLGHTPGGSSSGSAAAVSSGMCSAALGSQTGGSTIRPAAYCGIVGLKPTYGRISRHGVIPLSWCLDHVGIFTRSVRDASIILEVLAGHDPRDTSSSTLPVTAYSRRLDRLSPPKIGVLGGLFQEMADLAVNENYRVTVELLEEAGARVYRAELPERLTPVLSAHHVIMSVETAAVHQEVFQRRMMDYQPNLRGMISSGLLVSASTYLKAQRIRRRFIREIAETLKPFDCLSTPATTTPAPRGLESTGDPAFNAPWSFCGFPSITIPSGLTGDGLPLGIQLVAAPFDEVNLLRAARWCEMMIDFGSAPRTPDR